METEPDNKPENLLEEHQDIFDAIEAGADADTLADNFEAVKLDMALRAVGQQMAKEIEDKRAEYAQHYHLLQMAWGKRKSRENREAKQEID
ncbi:MAG: hypothetical protein ABIB97_01635 [Patescibacteria group bacterium]